MLLLLLKKLSLNLRKLLLGRLQLFLKVQQNEIARIDVRNNDFVPFEDLEYLALPLLLQLHLVRQVRHLLADAVDQGL